MVISHTYNKSNSYMKVNKSNTSYSSSDLLKNQLKTLKRTNYNKKAHTLFSQLVEPFNLPVFLGHGQFD